MLMHVCRSFVMSIYTSWDLPALEHLIAYVWVFYNIQSASCHEFAALFCLEQLYVYFRFISHTNLLKRTIGTRILQYQNSPWWKTILQTKYIFWSFSFNYRNYLNQEPCKYIIDGQEITSEVKWSLKIILFLKWDVVILVVTFPLQK